MSVAVPIPSVQPYPDGGHRQSMEVRFMLALGASVVRTSPYSAGTVDLCLNSQHDNIRCADFAWHSWKVSDPDGSDNFSLVLGPRKVLVLSWEKYHRSSFVQRF